MKLYYLCYTYLASLDGQRGFLYYVERRNLNCIDGRKGFVNPIIIVYLTFSRNFHI